MDLLWLTNHAGAVGRDWCPQSATLGCREIGGGVREREAVRTSHLAVAELRQLSKDLLGKIIERCLNALRNYLFPLKIESRVRPYQGTVKKSIDQFYSESTSLRVNSAPRNPLNFEAHQLWWLFKDLVAFMAAGKVCLWKSQLVSVAHNFPQIFPRKDGPISW